MDFNEVLLHVTPPQEWVMTWLHLAQSTTVPDRHHGASTFLTHLFPVCCVNHLFYWLFKVLLFSIREPSDLSKVSLWLLPQKPKKWYLKEMPVCLSIASLVQFYFLLHLIVQKSNQYKQKKQKRIIAAIVQPGLQHCETALMVHSAKP